jgi:putative transposase
LRTAIKNLGRIPKSVYLDNGKAFKAKFFTHSNEGFEIFSGLYSRLGIATQFATPYRAQVKPVEGFFKTIDG